MRAFPILVLTLFISIPSFGTVVDSKGDWSTWQENCIVQEANRHLNTLPAPYVAGTLKITDVELEQWETGMQPIEALWYHKFVAQADGAKGEKFKVKGLIRFGSTVEQKLECLINPAQTGKTVNVLEVVNMDDKVIHKIAGQAAPRNLPLYPGDMVFIGETYYYTRWIW